MVAIVDKVLAGLSQKEHRQQIHDENTNRRDEGPAALALGKPSTYEVDDRIGGTHTRKVKDAVVHEQIVQHAHHEVTPIVNREREETEIFQKVQPILDQQEVHTHHQHVAPQVSRHVQEDITEEHATKYLSQSQYGHQQTVGDQTHSTSVNAPIVREHVNKHIIEEIQPIIQRQTQRVEHHHTTQQINEVHVKAPVIHSVVHAPAISMAEFTGKVAELGKGHLGHSHTGSSGSIGSSSGAAGGLGSRGVGSGLTGHQSGTGLTGHQSSGNGLTGHQSSGHGVGSAAPLAAGAAGATALGSHHNHHDNDGGLNEAGRTGHGLNLGHMENKTRANDFEKNVGDGKHNNPNSGYSTSQTGAGGVMNAPSTAVGSGATHHEEKKPSLIEKIIGKA